MENHFEYGRRQFLGTLGAASLGWISKKEIPWETDYQILKQLAREAVSDMPTNSRHPDQQSCVRISQDETFWAQVRMMYTVSPNLINLNNGGVSPAPKPVLDALIRYNTYCNEAPSYYMWRILDQGREPLRANLAKLADVDPEEIAINRNASEALETAIFGIPLQRGDEVVLTRQDYPNMINAWKQREMRDGIVLKWVNHELPSEDDDALAEKYLAQFTPRTRVVHITHVINWCGQIMPVRKIADVAKKKGILVLVDGAHSFCHVPFTIKELNCDFFGTSLHKWLGAPIGSGLLYVRKERIAGLYPLFGANEAKSPDIRKFESLGTRSFAIEQAIGEALLFQEMVGLDRKVKRLHYLKEYWNKQLRKVDGVHFRTPVSAEYSGAISMITVANKTPPELDKILFEKFKIHGVSIEWEDLKGVRITPNIYTTLNELDTLVEGIHYALKV